MKSTFLSDYLTPIYHVNEFNEIEYSNINDIDYYTVVHNSLELGKIKLLIDTGSGLNIINTNLFETLPYDLKEKLPRPKTANGISSQFKLREFVILTVQGKDSQYRKFKFWKVDIPDKHTKLIMGRSMLRKMGYDLINTPIFSSTFRQDDYLMEDDSVFSYMSDYFPNDTINSKPTLDDINAKNPEIHKYVSKIVKKYHLKSTHRFDVGNIKFGKYKVGVVDGTLPIKSAPYPTGPFKQKIIDEQVSL